MPSTGLAQCVPTICSFILGVNYLVVCREELLSAAFLINFVMLYVI